MQYSVLLESIVKTFQILKDNEHLIRDTVIKLTVERKIARRKWLKRLDFDTILIICALGLYGIPITCATVGFLYELLPQVKRTYNYFTVTDKLLRYNALGIIHVAREDKDTRVYELDDELKEIIKSIIIRRMSFEKSYIHRA